MSVVIHNNIGGEIKHKTFCARCGTTMPKTVNFNRSAPVTVCSKCRAMMYGFGVEAVCGACGAELWGCSSRSLHDAERVPSVDLCESCKGERSREEEVVANGGAFVRCAECGKSGVVVPKHGLELRAKLEDGRFASRGEDGKYPQFGVVFQYCHEHGGSFEMDKGES